MSKLQDRLAIYAQELREICGILPDMALLERVTLALGPQALGHTSAQIHGGDSVDFAKFVANFMAHHDLPSALHHDMARAVLDAYPKPQRYRAVIAYLIAQNFGLRARLIAGQSFNL